MDQITQALSSTVLALGESFRKRPFLHWIEHSPRRRDYDLLVLDRDSLAGCTEDAYQEGRNIAILSFFKFGMNYGMRHLLKGCQTLQKTKTANK